jgi:replication factor C large subunit
MKIWTEKYKPQRIEEIPQAQATIMIRNLLSKNKPIILHGPPGTGKTTLAHTLAIQEGFEIIEMNASDLRNKDAIKRIVKNAAEQGSLFGKGKIILIDEIDGLSGTKDRGGIQELARLLPTTRVPIIITTNDIHHKKLKPIKTKGTVLEFTKINESALAKVLRKICEKENITYHEDSLKKLIEIAKGDLRASINDLQTFSGEKELDTYGLLPRDQEESTFTVLQKVFKSEKAIEALLALENLGTDLNDFGLWLEENIPKEFSKAGEIAKAYGYLSKSKVFEGRIRRNQHWRFYAHQRIFLSAGINACKKLSNPNFTKYTRTSRLLKIWIHNQKHSIRKDIAAKIALKTHTSKADVVKNFPLHKHILRNNIKARKELKLSTEEISYLNKI